MTLPEGWLTSLKVRIEHARRSVARRPEWLRIERARARGLETDHDYRIDAYEGTDCGICGRPAEEHATYNPPFPHVSEHTNRWNKAAIARQQEKGR